jgi:hypothetical protein
LYRDRGDAENVFDELKNQWGWGGFTTQDLKRCSNSKWGSWQFSGVSVLLNLRWLACGTCCTSVQGGLMAAAAMDRSR